MYHALIVDDENRTIDALIRNIDWTDCHVEQIFRANNMEQALEVVNRERVDILICDIEMPNGSGLDLLEAITRRKQQPSCIFVTCHPEFHYMRRAIQLHCYDYLLKPIRYDEFTRVLKRLIQQLEREPGRKEEVTADPAGEVQPVSRRERNIEREVKNYIWAHLTDSLNVAEIAQALHFNPQYLMRAFKGKTGLSILEYITRTRVDAAKKILLETELPIREVSYKVGYTDYSYFTRVFRSEVGQTPSQYRSTNTARKF